MTENRWKTGLFVLAALLVAGVTSAEGANATFVPGLSSTGATAASLDPGEYAVFSFPAINRPNTAGLDFRVHMSGEATGDYTWLELSPTGTEWLGFYGPPGDNFAAASSANATDALAMGWGFYAGDRVDFGVNW